MNELLAQRAEGGRRDIRPPDAALLREVFRLIRVMGPVKIADLATFANVSRREIEAAVQQLRKDGDPIVGDSDGLHLTEDPDEIRHYIKVRQGRAAELYLGNRALRVTMQRLKESQDAEAGLTLWPAA